MVRSIDISWLKHEPIERCSKLQLKLNGNYSSLREILAPSLRDHSGSLRAVNFSNWACASLREDKFLRFGELLLARCRREADFGRGHLCFSYSPLIGFFLGFSASGLLCLACGFAYYPAYSSKYGESTIMLLRVSVGHIMGRNPFACAKLARTLREIPWTTLETRAHHVV